jgi:hypothetical protein
MARTTLCDVRRCTETNRSLLGEPIAGVVGRTVPFEKCLFYKGFLNSGLVGWGTRIPTNTRKCCQGADLTVFFPANDGLASLPWTTFGDHATTMSQDIPS